MKYLEMLRNNVAAIDEARAAFIARMDTIAAGIESRGGDKQPTAAEADEFRRLEEWTKVTDEETDMRSRLKELEDHEARATAAGAAKFPTPNLNIGGASDPYDIDLRSTPRTPDAARDIESRALKALEEAPDLNDDQRSAVDARLRNRSTNRHGALSRHLLVTGSEAYRSAFVKLVTRAQPILTAEEADAVERALNITTDSAGGYLMPFTLDPTVILTNNGAINPIRDLATVKEVATDNWQGITSTGITAAYGAESAVVADGTPDFGQPTVPIEKAHAFVPFTMEAEDDLASLSTDAAVMFADAKMRLEATKFTLGAGHGSTEPYGLITALVSASLIKTSATTDTYAVADVYALGETLPARWRSEADWMMALPIINKTRQFGTALGHAFLTDLGGGKPPLLLGQGLHENSEMDAVINGSAENYIAVYGDFKGYHIHDRIGLSIELVPHLFDTSTGRPTGERGWYARWRNGANLVAPSLRVLNVT